MERTDKYIINKDGSGIVVTEIDEGAYEGCTTLKSIVIPDGVIRICDFAFRNCI